jgi:2-oxoglutarate ferredoxin oxidoreductase subunit delta
MILHSRKSRIETSYVKLNTHHCEACWKCVETCPNQVFGKVGKLFHKHAIIINSSACTGCMKCFRVCEYNAIKKMD